jgi:hypothetical protein
MNLAGIHVDRTEDFRGAITGCDRQGIIFCLNKYSVERFSKYDEASLIGTNLLNCHFEPSKTKLQEMLKVPQAKIF